MTKKFICNNKYEVRGPNGDVIGLPLSLKGLPNTIILEGVTLTVRTSFHCSLVCIGKIIEKYELQIPDFKDKVIEDFCIFIKNDPIELSCYRNEFRFVTHNDRKSLVVMCDISNLEKFFNVLNKKYNLVIEYPPTHVTLYTLQQNLGIFLTDLYDIQNLTKVIPNPLGFVVQ